ncbi:MAG: hypothetical protein ACK2T6_06010 [Anaerolineae bacterium]
MLLLKLVVAVAAVFAVLSLLVGPRRAWELWRAFGQLLGDAIARVAMTVFYFTVFVPFAFVARSAGDPLGLRTVTPPYWKAVEPADDTIEAARRQH